METLLGRTALAFSGESHDVADLVLVGLLTGEWQTLEDNVAHGIALEARQVGPCDGDVAEAVRAFRYERRLIAAAELQTWLSERSLRLCDLEGVLRRRGLREAHDPRDSPVHQKGPDKELMRSEAICGGWLMRWAETLKAWQAGCLAVHTLDIEPPAVWPPAPAGAEVEVVVTEALADMASGLPTLAGEVLRRRARRLVSLKDGYTWLRLNGVAEVEVDARVAEHRLDWTVVHGNELSFDRQGAALETRLRVRYDGDTLGVVAKAIGRTTLPCQLELGAMPASVAAELLAAYPGELIGPWRHGDCWRVLELGRRVEPGSAVDGHLRSRGRDELLDELVGRFAAGKAAIVAAL